jgi:hypothetical protein
MVKKIVLPLLILFLLCTSAWAVEYVRLGALQDVTGATSDVGKDEALGVREAVAYVNDTGGINGKPIKLFQYDYGYRVPEAITTYKRFRDYDKVVAVIFPAPSPATSAIPRKPRTTSSTPPIIQPMPEPPSPLGSRRSG